MVYGAGELGPAILMVVVMVVVPGEGERGASSLRGTHMMRGEVVISIYVCMWMP